MNISIYNALKDEEERQHENIELIASENFVSEDVRRLAGSVFTNKYCEGYPEQSSIDKFIEKHPDFDFNKFLVEFESGKSREET